MRIYFRFCLLFVLGCLLSASTNKTSNLTGSVTDDQLRPLMGVTIVMRNIGNNTFKGGLSDNTGHYEIKGLTPEVYYEATLSYTGYPTLRKDSIILLGGETRRMDFTMQ